MRTELALLLGCVTLTTLACGGNVVVDPGTQGHGASSSTSSSSAGTGGVSSNCTNLSGEAFTNGGCQTNATCSGSPVVVVCMPNGSGFTCTCEVNGTTTGTCTPQTSDMCSPTMGCCKMYVGG